MPWRACAPDSPPVPAALPRQGAHSGSNSKQEWQTQRSHRPAVLSSPASAAPGQSSCYDFKSRLGGRCQNCPGSAGPGRRDDGLRRALHLDTTRDGKKGKPTRRQHGRKGSNLSNSRGRIFSVPGRGGMDALLRKALGKQMEAGNAHNSR